MTPTVTASMPASGRSLASASKKKPSKPPVRPVLKRSVKVPTSTAHRERSIPLSVAGPATAGRDDATLSCHRATHRPRRDRRPRPRARRGPGGARLRDRRSSARRDRSGRLEGRGPRHRLRPRVGAAARCRRRRPRPLRRQRSGALPALGIPERPGHGRAPGHRLARRPGPRAERRARPRPSGDLVTPLIAAMADPSVAVAGGWGVATHDLRHFQAAGPGDVAAVEGSCLAFRRAGYVARGPFDEHFRFYRNLDIWGSLALRDEGEEARPRRALTLPLPALRHEHRGWTSVPEAERDRLSRRNFYRIIDRFGWRNDLVVDRS